MRDGFISLKDLKASAFTASGPETEERERAENDIAIIGMSGRFGEAHNLKSFWDVLLNGKECIRELPLSRKADADRYLEFSGEKSQHENINYTKIAYMEEIDKFDCSFLEYFPMKLS